jgi:DNA adenine methylase
MRQTYSFDRSGRPDPAKPNPREAQPFLKWAGGKAQLLEQFDRFFPERIERYVEPFLGGGAVFFHLQARFLAVRARLRDNNEQLVNCYRVLRDQPEALMDQLDAHLARFDQDRDRYYYLVRAGHHLADPLERAARMIFLNKTCYNGLWRVNAKGEFNVPIGSYKKVSLYDRDNILAASAALRNADLAVKDFRDTLAEARPGDFVYIDPPYHPVSRTANFTSYTKDDFGEAEQEELAALFADAARRGARLMLSNSDTPVVRKLYREFAIRCVQARRAINSKAERRGAVSEVLVLSWAEG